MSEKLRSLGSVDLGTILSESLTDCILLSNPDREDTNESDISKDGCLLISGR